MAKRFTVETGREIHFDGKPFISISREGSTRPVAADEVTHIIAAALNADAYDPDHMPRMRKIAYRHNIQVFKGVVYKCRDCDAESADASDGSDLDHAADCNRSDVERFTGWFWQSCSPGCLPDADTSGPFENERQALEDATNELSED